MESQEALEGIGRNWCVFTSTYTVGIIGKRVPFYSTLHPTIQNHHFKYYPVDWSSRLRGIF
jgi:hypothetical protein